MEKIQIGLTLSVEINYLNLLINSMIMLSKNPKNLEFIIGIDTGPGKGNVNLEWIKKRNFKIIKYNTKLPYSSMAHGMLMDKLLEEFNTEFGMLVDSDVCFLKQNWDEIFKNKLKENNLIYIGTKNAGETRKFPGPYCMFFKTEEMKKMKYSTQPVQSVYFEKNYDFGEKFKNSINNKTKLSGCNFVLEKNASIYNLQDGETTYFDTNSQFNIFFQNMSDKYKLMECMWPGDSETKFLFNKNTGQGNEYQIDKEPILTHQGRTHRGWGRDPKNIKWVNQVKKWFSKEDLKTLFDFK